MKKLITEFVEDINGNLEELNPSLPEAEYNEKMQPILDQFLSKISGQYYNTFPHSIIFSLKNSWDASTDSSEKEEAWNLFLIKSIEKLNSDIVGGTNSDKKTEAKKAIRILSKMEESFALMNQQKIMVHTLQSEQIHFYKNQTDLFKKKVKDLEGEVEKSHKLLLNTQKAQEEINRSQKDTQKEFVTILGIFTTIIFAAFGGLQLLAEMFKNMDDVSVNKAVIHGSFIFISLVLILSLLFSGLSKMTELSIRSCTCSDRESCTCTVRKKHPTIFYSFILVTVVGMFAVVDGFIGFKSTFLNVLSATKGVSWLNLKDLIELSIFCILPALVIIILDFLVGKVMSWRINRKIQNHE